MLVCKTVHTLGYLFFLHPQVTHHVSLKGILHKAITDVKHSKAEVEVIDPNALDYHLITREDNEEQATTVAAKKQAEFNTDDSKLIPIPFELYQMDVGHGNGSTLVATKAIGIKSNVEY